jgi:6-pyruvoyltetrahydropterin/6-carboxytetrahydropterin synthase
VVEVSVRGPLERATGRTVDLAVLDELVQREVVGPFDHRNLNTEVPVFASVVATSENLGVEICRRLKRNWKQVFPGEWPKLEKIRIGETARNIFEVRADEIE